MERSSRVRPRTEDEQPVAGLLDVGDDVRRQERRRAVGADRIDQHVQEFATGQRIQARQRFVEEEDRGSDAEGEGEADLRLLTAGQLLGGRVERDVEVIEPTSRDRRIEPRAERSSPS